MNIATEIQNQNSAQERGNTELLKVGSAGLDSYLQKAEALKSALGKLAEIGDDRTAKSVLRLCRQLDAFEPSITMIGQVKAGKTSLVNAMIGLPDLLPADVNPWTSVVTSLHMSPEPISEGNSAVFKFFDDSEWGRLVSKGGRIGELASRAGADDDLENVRRQIADMREKSRERLGKRFELLLGQEHDYGYFDKELIERYVCLGDDFGDDESVSDTQGRFADITKSADLYFQRPEFKTRLCIRDTPGVNDTFMMREQITIRAIRDSRLCVVVLSAHQALSSVDMALIRLISNIKSREIVIFVNRIDELSDPSMQVPEIRESILATLEKHQGPTDAQIIFGSAYWAGKALSDTLDGFAGDSARSLVNWAEKELVCSTQAQSAEEMIWGLSGIPALFGALTERIAEGSGQETIDKVARSAINLANGLHATNQVVSSQLKTASLGPTSKDEIYTNLKEIEERGLELLQAEFETIIARFQARIDKSHQVFLDRATASLITHLERYGEQAVWKYDPAGLRVLLRSSYLMFGNKSQGSANMVFQSVAMDICEIYARSFGIKGSDFNIQVPPLPRVPPPVFLGQTIALDLQGSWWKSWWQRRRGYQAFATNFYNMIMEETDPIVNELKISQANSIHSEADAILREFLAEQRAILMSVLEQADADHGDLNKVLGVQARQDRKRIVEAALTTLNRYVA
ncbi:MAG: dynamin family protein [Halocynthiibacter sp.]